MAQLIPAFLFGGLIAAVLGTIIGRFELSAGQKVWLTIIQAFGAILGSFVARPMAARFGERQTFLVALAAVGGALGNFGPRTLYLSFAVFAIGMGALGPTLNLLALNSGSRSLNRLVGIYSLGLAVSPFSTAWMTDGDASRYGTLLAGAAALTWLISAISISSSKRLPSRRNPVWRTSSQTGPIIIYQLADAILLRFLIYHLFHKENFSLQLAFGGFSAYALGLGSGRLLLSCSERLTSEYRVHLKWITAAASVLALAAVVGRLPFTVLSAALLLGFVAGPYYAHVLNAATDDDEKLFLQSVGTFAPLMTAGIVYLFGPELAVHSVPVLWLTLAGIHHLRA